MATAGLAPIVLDERGVAYIEGTRTKVRHVVLVKQTSGLSPEEVQQQLPHLTLAQVYAALAYYHAHRAEMDAEIQQSFEFAEKLRQEAGESPVGKRLRGEGKLP